MSIRFLYSLTLTGLSTLSSFGYSRESMTGNMPTYLQSCLNAAEDPSFFQDFRSNPDYRSVLECGFVGESVEYLFKKGSPETLEKLESFEKLDRFGTPGTGDISGLGQFSGATLRYIVIADQITQLFDLPSNAKIVEIGAGFGGQCYILSQMIPFSHYFIYDLPEVDCLIKKMMQMLSVENVYLMPLIEDLPQKVDLLISNYAFSECDRQTQLDYFEKVVKNADRGYMILNQLGYFDSLTPKELFQLLEDNHMNPKIYEEPIFTYEGNLLIVWDKTKD